MLVAAIPTVPDSPTLEDRYAAALLRSNAWRGQTLHIFAKAEAAVTEMLVILAALPERGIGVRLPHLVGQRFEALTDAMHANGPFAAEGQPILPLMMQLKAELRLRAALAHGVGRVTIDRTGRWTMILRVAGLKAGQLCHDVSIVEEREADAVRADLHRIVQQLCSRIETLKTRLTP